VSTLDGGGNACPPSVWEAEFEIDHGTWRAFSYSCTHIHILRVEFLLKTDSGYPRDAEVTLFTLANP